MFKTMAQKETLARKHFSYLDMYDYDENEILQELIVTASEPDDFLLAGGGMADTFKQTYSLLRSDESEIKLNPVFAFLLSSISLPVYMKMLRDQKYLRELATIEIARRKRPAFLKEAEEERAAILAEEKDEE